MDVEGCWSVCEGTSVDTVGVTTEVAGVVGAVSAQFDVDGVESAACKKCREYCVSRHTKMCNQQPSQKLHLQVLHGLAGATSASAAHLNERKASSCSSIQFIVVVGTCLIMHVSVWQIHDHNLPIITSIRALILG